jgi:hypothetical protein
VLRYETTPALVGGIELDAQGRKFAWSIADYLGSLARDVDALVQRTPGRSDPMPTPARAEANGDRPPAPAGKPATADDPA